MNCIGFFCYRRITYYKDMLNLNFTTPPPPPFTPLLQHNTLTATLATVEAIECSIISNKETIEEKLIIFLS